MEKYVQNGMINELDGIKYGKYSERVYRKLVASYGECSAEKIRGNSIETFKEIQNQKDNPSKSNNVLLVGKVQSGKTSNLEFFTALAFDNSYNLVVIYGGYDGTLVEQTKKRFSKTFDVKEEFDYSDDSPVILSTEDRARLLSIDEEIIEDLQEYSKPIIIISMKRPSAMKKVNELLKTIYNSKFNAFIIDDEGDQASLNTKKNKIEDASATYNEIKIMKARLEDPLYLSVTATPQANIFLNELSSLRPEMIRTIEPGNGYTGAEVFHLHENNIIQTVSGEDLSLLEQNQLPPTIRDAINCFILSSTIMKLGGKVKSDMIIHTFREVDQQSILYNCVESYVNTCKTVFKNGDLEEQGFVISELKDSYDKFFNSEIKRKYSFDSINKCVGKVIKRLYIVLKNSSGKATQANLEVRKHKIHIGGDLLQRGVTFDNLVTTYFTRWAQNGGNMDTNLQRCRWFGYRSEYLELCKIFIPQEIAEEFAGLAEMEIDLWEQFYQVQNGELQIEDILVQSENTNQNLTRSGIVDVKEVSFANRWMNQKMGVFDKSINKKNFENINLFLSKLDLTETTVGRNDSKPTAKFSNVKVDDFLGLINKLNSIFEISPFDKRTLIEYLRKFEEVSVILMNSHNTDGRVRSFYSDNKIYALHQGADNTDKSKIKYRGDNSVIIDKERVNIQIHKIIPKKKEAREQLLDEYTQYMFSIYIPTKKTFFMKG